MRTRFRVLVLVLMCAAFTGMAFGGKSNTTTTLTSSLNPSTYGASVTFTATVSPSAATGTVTFKDGSTTLGTGALSSGVATYSTSTLAVGSHSITATYGGDTHYNGSTSFTLTQTVNKANTTTTVASSLNPSTYGASVTFTAAVTPSTATGTITFKDGSTTLGTGTLSSGTATYSTSTLAVGSHSITASYGGDGNDNSSTSSALTQTVNKAGTTTTVASSANPSTYGSSVTFTATVAPSTATGTVTFMDGSTTLGTGTISSGTATYGTSALGAGSHSITASYGGDGNYNSSTSSTLTQTVNKATTTTGVASSANPSTYGSSVTFTATISPSTATGTVTFKDGGTALGTSTISSGSATYSTSTLTAGSHSITASYGGDGNNNGSTSSTLTQTVNVANSTTALSSSANNSTYGSSVTFTATVTPSIATGTVTFKDGGTTLGTGTISSGNATYTTSSLAVGSHSITASYGGDANDNGSASSILAQTVNKANTTTAVNSSANPSTYGASVTLTATVTPSTATGTVTFTDGSTTLGTGTLSSGTATYSTSTLSVGSHSLTASYGGDGSYNSSTSSTLIETVNSAPQITTSSLPNGTAGSAYSATLAATAGTTPYSWAISAGSLPAGLSLNASTGAISGTPTIGGTTNFTAQVTDANSVAATQVFSIAVAPAISGLSPTSGPTGTSVTISGSGFGTTQGTSSVAFNGTTASVSSWGASSIGTTVPNGATSGNVVVTVGGIASSGSSFTVTPSITSLSLTTGAVGALVTISGSNFGTSQGSSTVTFNGTTAAITSWSATSIGTMVPTGATTGNVVVTVGGYASNGSAFTVVPAPSITSLSITSGPTGVPVTITGSNFGSTQGSGTVTFNGTLATVVSWGTGSIAVTVPPGATTGNVVVNASGVSSNGVNFTVLPSPSITSLNPTSGVPGNMVTITGANFGSSQGTSTVTFNGLAATPATWGQNSITVPVPAGATSGNVVVTVNGGMSNPATFTVTLTITGMTPQSGMVGTAVTLTGQNFGDLQGTSTVTISTLSAPVIGWSDTSIVAQVPTGATSGPFSVTVNGQTVNSSSFTVTLLPTGWSDADIGSVGQAGSATFSSGAFTVTGAGGGIGGTADAMHFVYQSLTGDGSITARLANLQGPSSYPQAGVMIRETLSAGSKEAYVYYHPNQAYFGSRSTTGGSLSYQAGGPSGIPYPGYWVRLTRSGNVFTGFISPDGVNWTQIGTSTTITMAQGVYIGLAVSGNGYLETATFDNVSINSTATPAPVITSLSATTAPVGTAVAVIGANFGATQGGSAVLLNGTPVSLDVWGDTGIVFTVPVGATSGPLLVSVAPSMNDSNAVSFAVTSQPLPPSWLDQDVGVVGTNQGSATFSNEVLTVTGAGGGIGGTADGMHFAYQTLTGDGSITARVATLQGSSSYPQAGVMIRETLNPGSSDAFVYYHPNQAYFEYRSTTGGSAANQTAGPSGIPNPGYWVRLVRSGNAFTGFISPDGVNWTQIGTSVTITMAQSVYIGLAVSGNGYLETATFDNVSLNSTATPAPVITGLSATTATVGSQVQINGNNFGATQGGSVVLLHGVSLPINYWSNTSIVVTVPTGATSGPLLVSVAPSMNDSNAVTLTITSQPLPAPWLDQDIGVVGSLIGSGTYSNGVFTVNGAGGGVGGTADAMHFVYQTLTGDGSITARVANLQGSGPYYPEAGAMIRETLSPGSTTAFAYYSPNRSYLTYRSATGGSAATQTGPSATYPGYWVRLTRTGNLFTGFISTDGVNWNQIGAGVTISMAQTVYMGLAVSGQGYMETATIDNVSVGIGTTPFVSSVTPLVGTIGTLVTVSGSNFGTTQGTSTVSFNGVAATSISSWTGSQIVASVPSGTPVGKGPVVVTVNSISSPGTAGSLFTVINPVITSLAPPAGPPNGTLVINGSGFGASQNGGVSINGVNATALNACPQLPWSVCWSDTQIHVLVPSNATSGSVTVSNNGITSNAVPFTVTAPPAITGISPTTGTTGLSVTINGSAFGPMQSSSTVAFGGYNAAVVSWSDTQIVATVPPLTYSGNVSVTVAGIIAQGPLFIVDGYAQVTASNSAVTTYQSTGVGGAWGILNVNGPGCSTCPRGNQSNTFDNNANLLSHTDGNGHLTNYTYDSDNNLLTQAAHLDANTPVTTTYTYNSFGEVLTMTDALGNTTTNTYDAKGNLLTVTTPPPDGQTASSITQFAYDTKGELIQIVDPLNHLTTLTYYPTGLIQSITDAQNNTTSYTYDARGNRTGVIDPINGSPQPTVFAYDVMNRLTGITYPDNSSVSFGYDDRGRRTSATDQNNRTTTYGYDDADRLTSVTDAASHQTTYAYDNEDNLTSIQDANHNTTSFQYDTLGRVTQTTFPSTLIETYGYDQMFNLTSKTDRKNQPIQYVYDALDRLTSKDYPDSTSASYVYDLVGKIRQVNDPTGTYGFAYDNMGRLTGTTTQYSFLPGYNFQNAYSYDAASNRQYMVAPDGSYNSYQYDRLNRLSSLTNSLTGQFGFSYDALSRRTQLTRPNGINTNYTYDSVSHLLSVLHQSGSTTLDGASYGYDAAGNRTSKTNYLNGITEGYTYDLIYQLTQVAQGLNTTESYSYDNAGNRLSSLTVPTYNYNSSNELTSSSLGSYTYDANGNTLSDAQGRSYTWDFENRLTQAVNPGVGTTTFKYDPFGRRIQKSGPLGTTNYVYDGQWENVIEEVDNSGNILARYNQEMGLDLPLSEFRTSVASYYEQDGVNSVTSLSNSTGSLANSYTYDAFGKQTASTGTLTNPFQYTAREFDSETGVYEYRSRYYDQNLGRFLGEDPVGFSSETYNLYDYVSGDPVDFNDPSGNRRIHGNWCGPNWTGGQTEPYIPSHDHDGYYKDPRDYVDKVCSHHDKCYEKCRAKHPCSPWGRRICNRKCDFFLMGRTVANPKDIYNPWAYVVGLGITLDFIPPAGPNGGPEPDRPVSCPCK